MNRYLDNFLSIRFKDILFDGLLLKWSDQGFPWKNNKEREKYLSDLVEEGSDLSSLRYKNLLSEIGKREIQIKISWGYVIRTIGSISFSLCFLFGFNGYQSPALMTALIGIISFLSSEYFERRANEFYTGLSTGSDLVDLMFQMEKNNGEIEFDENF